MKFNAIQLDNMISNLLSKEPKLSNQVLVLSIAYLAAYSFYQNNCFHYFASFVY